MKCDRNTMLLYAITDRAWTGKQSLAEQVESALKGGATCVQLREKELSDAEFLASAIELSALCKRYGVPFFVNDNVEIAIECGADGVHVGQDDMAVAQVRRRVGDAMLIGVSAHSVEEARDAVENGADCLGVGALFATNTKQGANVLPKEVLRDICAAVNVPVVAIGGIKKTNIAQLVGAGVAGVAVVSAIFGADDIESETRLLRQLSEEMVNA
ncbi:MAG: thiamine phosphate synthase [Thermoguttaceae bacterium]|jgi:thiamine-phosphate pyrophosphorylase|nr:thiamine phosphate synthase [Thermoguttaceae bacterium]